MLVLTYRLQLTALQAQHRELGRYPAERRPVVDGYGPRSGPLQAHIRRGGRGRRREKEGEGPERASRREERPARAGGPPARGGVPGAGREELHELAGGEAVVRAPYLIRSSFATLSDRRHGLDQRTGRPNVFCSCTPPIVV